MREILCALHRVRGGDDMQFKLITQRGDVLAMIELYRAELAGGGPAAGWDLATTRVQEAGFDVLDWTTDLDGARTLVVADEERPLNGAEPPGPSPPAMGGCTR
jgi:hypothetical protein